MPWILTEDNNLIYKEDVSQEAFDQVQENINVKLDSVQDKLTVLEAGTVVVTPVEVTP